MTHIVKTIDCSIRHDGARILTWQLIPGVRLPDDAELYLECSRAGAPWEVLTGNLIDTCSFIDTRKRNYNKRLDECYRIRVISRSADTNDVSDAIDAGNHRAYPYSAAAENILKQAEIEFKQSGCTGVLLKRRVAGPRCPRCVEADGQQSLNEHCPDCLGTGILGGYYPGIALTVIKDAIEVSESRSQLGYMESETVTGRCIAYPWVRRGDIWVEDTTDKRYVFISASPNASYKQTALMLSIRMGLLERSDVMYSDNANNMVKDVGLNDAVIPDIGSGSASPWDDLGY